LLEAVEGKAEGPIFHTGFQHEERPLSQHGGGQKHPSYDVILVVLREHFGHSLASYLVSRLGQEQRVIRQPTVLACPLQIALVLTKHIAFEDVLGDL
jgi:hypothetical protein